MKDADFKDKSSPRGFGKGLIIVIVVVFSSLSFVLGYFVGKLGRDERSGPSGNVAESAVPLAPGIAPPQPAKTEITTSVALPADQTLPTVPPDPAKQAPAGINPPSPEHETEKAGPKEPPPAVTKEQQVAKKKAATVEDKAAQRPSGGEVYTVQLGALRKAPEAKKLRSKLEKKGYKTFLFTAKNKRHEKIYKVRVGEFKRKKDADVLALKLKKTEGLNAFVTVKD